MNEYIVDMSVLLKNNVLHFKIKRFSCRFFWSQNVFLLRVGMTIKSAIQRIAIFTTVTSIFTHFCHSSTGYNLYNCPDLMIL